jgi:hypothetical protein
MAPRPSDNRQVPDPQIQQGILLDGVDSHLQMCLQESDKT